MNLNRAFNRTQLIVVSRSDDTTFGVLNSRFQELWSLKLGTTLEDRSCYRPTTSFETFPFLQGLTPANTAPIAPFRELIPAIIADLNQRQHALAIANAAFNLNQRRDNCPNPPEWADWVITPEEEKAGFPKRPVAKPGHKAELKKRTLTILYNAKPAWLVNAHQILDKAVATAYGWNDYTPEMTDAEILQRLLKLKRH